MATRSVKLTIPNKLFNDSKQAVQEFGYLNIQDLTLDALRKEIHELKKQKALYTLEKNFGSVKPTNQNRKKIAQEYLKKKPSEILRKYKNFLCTCTVCIWCLATAYHV